MKLDLAVYEYTCLIKMEKIPVITSFLIAYTGENMTGLSCSGIESQLLFRFIQLITFALNNYVNYCYYNIFL